MKYFLLESDSFYSNAPSIINWFGKIDKGNICLGKSHLLPQRMLFEIKNDKDLIFTDIVTHPFLLISDGFQKLVKLYQPRTPFKQVVLMDMITHNFKLYHLPILKKIDCLLEESKTNLDRSEIKEAVLDYEKIKDYSLFQLDNVKGTHIVIRLDLLESALRRKMTGLYIREVEQR